MLCQVCYGSGQIMGNGYQMQDCPKCGYFRDEVSATVVIEKPVIDKRSKSYREAIKQLSDLHPEMSRSEVAELFDNEYKKVNVETNTTL